MITAFILAPHTTCLRRFLYRFISPLLPPPISSGSHRRTYHFYTLSPHPLLARRDVYLNVDHAHFPRKPPPLALRPTPHACVCHHIPRRSPPCWRPWPEPSYLSPLGGSPVAGTFAPLCPASLPVCCSASCHLLGLGSSGCHFCARMGAPGASTPWQLLIPTSLPRYIATPSPSGYQDPPPHRPSLPPTWSSLYHTRRRSWWGLFLECSRCHFEFGIHRRG